MRALSLALLISSGFATIAAFYLKASESKNADTTAKIALGLFVSSWIVAAV
jgi:hypothetical protein